MAAATGLKPEAKPKASGEKALALLWERAHTLSEGLVTEDGQRFRVCYPGRRSSRAGPDFRDSIIVTESGEQIVGDVELHLDSSGWRHHGHDSDRRYNGVVLHVVLRPKAGRTVTQAGVSVPVASLEKQAPGLDADRSGPAAVAGPVPALDPAALGSLLDGAGDDRFFARSSGFVLEMEKSGPDQVVYGALMEALGYASNRRPFRDLARRVPLATLVPLRFEPPATRLMAIKAMLLSAAGLLDEPVLLEEATQLRRLAGVLPGGEVMPRGRWHLFRLRPANHPVRRILGAAHLIDRYLAPGMARGLENDVRGAEPALLARRLAFPPFVGAERAREMAVSVVLPFTHAWAELAGDGPLRTLSLELFRRFPRLADNEVTREMKRLLGAASAGIEIRSARRHQGLMKLYRDWVGQRGRHYRGSAEPPAAGGKQEPRSAPRAWPASAARATRRPKGSR
jgi:hypothetical protein